METSSLTDKSLRDLENRLQKLLSQEFSSFNNDPKSPTPEEAKQMNKSPSKRIFEQQELKPSPSKHEISNNELLNITYSKLPDINLSKNQIDV